MNRGPGSVNPTLQSLTRRSKQLSGQFCRISDEKPAVRRRLLCGRISRTRSSLCPTTTINSTAWVVPCTLIYLLLSARHKIFLSERIAKKEDIFYGLLSLSRRKRRLHRTWYALNVFLTIIRSILTCIYPSLLLEARFLYHCFDFALLPYFRVEY